MFYAPRMVWNTNWILHFCSPIYRRQHAADVAAQIGSGNMSSLIAKLREQVAGGEDDEDSDDTEDDWDE